MSAPLLCCRMHDATTTTIIQTPPADGGGGGGGRGGGGEKGGRGGEFNKVEIRVAREKKERENIAGKLNSLGCRQLVKLLRAQSVKKFRETVGCLRLRGRRILVAKLVIQKSFCHFFFQQKNCEAVSKFFMSHASY